MLMKYMVGSKNQKNNDEEPKFDKKLITKISNIGFESASGLKYINIFLPAFHVLPV